MRLNRRIPAEVGLSLLLALGVGAVAAEPVPQTEVAAAPEPSLSPEEAEALAWQTLAAQAQLGLPEPAAILKKVEGQVTITGKQGQRQARPGMALQAGERVQSRKSSGAAMTLSDGSRVVLDERSAFELKAYEYDSTTQQGHMLLDFIGGKLRFISGLMSKKNADSVKIQAPTAVIGVRGTDFILEAAHADD